MVSTVQIATFLQLLVFLMDNAFNNDNFEKLFLVSVESVWRLSGYSSNWKWSLGKYLCYIWALSTRNSSQGRNVFDHHKFHTCRCVRAVHSVYVDKNSKFSSFCKALPFAHSFNFFSSFNVVATMESSQFDYRDHFYDRLILFLCNLSIFYALTLSIQCHIAQSSQTHV